MEIVTPAEVVRFWREAGSERWFAKDVAFDWMVRTRFLATHEAAARGELAAWEETPEGALALAILLDQFPRNMFRGGAHAFATDPLARAVSNRALARGFDRATDEMMRQFFYLPFMHSESLADQDRCVRLYEVTRELGAIAIRDYPSRHRREVRTLSRIATARWAATRSAAELEFLDGGGFAG